MSLFKVNPSINISHPSHPLQMNNVQDDSDKYHRDFSKYHKRSSRIIAANSFNQSKLHCRMSAPQDTFSITQFSRVLHSKQRILLEIWHAMSKCFTESIQYFNDIVLKNFTFCVKNYVGNWYDMFSIRRINKFYEDSSEYVLIHLLYIFANLPQISLSFSPFATSKYFYSHWIGLSPWLPHILHIRRKGGNANAELLIPFRSYPLFVLITPSLAYDCTVSTQFRCDREFRDWVHRIGCNNHSGNTLREFQFRYSWATCKMSDRNNAVRSRA
jgi:hypothetical protein